MYYQAKLYVILCLRACFHSQVCRWVEKLGKGIICDSWVAYVVLNTPDSKLYSVMGTLFSSTTTCTCQHTFHATRTLEHSAFSDDGRTRHLLSRWQWEAEEKCWGKGRLGCP